MAPVITRPSSEDDLTSVGSDRIPLGEYLFLRIAQANPRLRSIFGIPGDFNLKLLEHLYSDSVANKMDFVGICNELNAAYAADGYAKVIDGLSVLITTYGVGELSALNGIAGAFAEFAPVLHIVGTTSLGQMRQAQQAGVADIRNIHHLVQSKSALLAPDHDIYKKAASHFSVAMESLDDNIEANLQKIDKVISTILQENRPGYLFIPSDITDYSVPVSALNNTLQLSELNNAEMLEDITDKILSKFYRSHNPSILGDDLVSRFHARSEFQNLVAKCPSNFVKLFSTAMGRNVNEELDNFVGVYQGILSATPEITESMERRTDFLLTLGHMNNEINSGKYSTDFSKISDYVEVNPDYILIDGEYVQLKNPKNGKRAFALKDLIASLALNFDASQLLNNCGQNNITYKYFPPQKGHSEKIDSEVITQNRLIDFFNSYLQPNDILIVETCSFLFGVSDLKFPRGVRFFSQNFFGSIGYALPATLGASRAERDLGTNRRVILVQGDGSAQMTIQELSSYIRHDIQPPKIFLLNNEGYTVERVILGPERSYNDIQDTWRWTEFFKIFGDPEQRKHTARKVENIESLAQLAELDTGKIDMYELMLPKLDVPDRFHRLLAN